MYNLIDYNIITLWFYFIPLQKCYFMLLVCRGCQNILPSFYVIGLSWMSKYFAIILCFWSVVGVEIFCHHFTLLVCRGCRNILPSFYVIGLSWVSKYFAIILCYWSVVGVKKCCHHFMLWVLWVSKCFVIILCYGSVAGVVEVLSSSIFRCHGFCAITFIPVHWSV